MRNHRKYILNNFKNLNKIKIIIKLYFKNKFNG